MCGKEDKKGQREARKREYLFILMLLRGQKGGEGGQQAKEPND